MANNNHHRNNANQHKEPPIKKFMLGTKELENKIAEFEYDRGQYTITDVIGEERTEIYRSRNMQEAYMKWNVYIGRKKERPARAKAENAEATEAQAAPAPQNNHRQENRKNNNHSKNNRSRNRSQKRQTKRVDYNGESDE
ncbi:MAG: hypothetical protein II067_06305 [Agathobacter sp.]|uniref:hypothetical protein n=1 Tax=Agathobacter sp. TaxID=2021311 RepID=UPI00258008DC|nr:hypothetical protein [Agathobacter sp.]MBQ1681808.1 hypothetical protein [Agathobacter sp.]